MKKPPLFILILLIVGPLQAQRGMNLSEAELKRQRSIPVPRTSGVDTLFKVIFQSGDWNADAIRRFQESGWCKPSDRIPLDSFYEASKQWCIDRMGADRFYRNVKIDWQSLKDEMSKDIYWIRFYYFPDSLTDAMVTCKFRYYYFMGRKEIYPPENLRDIRLDATAYSFPVTQQKAIQIARDSVVGQDSAIKIRPPQFTDDFEWRFSIDTGKNGIKSFYIDARTGLVRDLKVAWRID